MTAWVRRASGKRPAVPRWNGGRMPLSSTLADAVVQQLALAGEGRYDTPELQCVRPLLEMQQRWSALPTPQTLLAEVLKTREGWHLFLYPFAGRQVHLGLASLLAWRVAQHDAAHLLDRGQRLRLRAAQRHRGRLADAAAAGAGRARREASASRTTSARCCTRCWPASTRPSSRGGAFARSRASSGLIFQGYPGEQRSNRQLQASSSLFYEVFRKYDPANRLLLQAEAEVLAQELEIGRLRASLRAHARRSGWCVQTLARPTPFAFPLMVERFREKLTNESWPTASRAWCSSSRARPRAH